MMKIAVLALAIHVVSLDGGNKKNVSFYFVRDEAMKYVLCLCECKLISELVFIMTFQWNLLS